MIIVKVFASHVGGSQFSFNQRIGDSVLSKREK